MPRNDIVVFLRYGDQTDFRVFAKQSIADVRPFSPVIETDDNKIWQRSLHALENGILFFNFADAFDVGLVGKSREYGLRIRPGWFATRTRIDSSRLNTPYAPSIQGAGGCA